jgi:hypothetical protein
VFQEGIPAVMQDLEKEVGVCSCETVEGMESKQPALLNVFRTNLKIFLPSNRIDVETILEIMARHHFKQVGCSIPGRLIFAYTGK